MAMIEIRGRQQLKRCDHFAAEPIGTTEARQLSDRSWLYSAAYRCPQCGVRFTETHKQTAPRSGGDAVA